ncbi:MAG: MAPEG family protein, partial [Pseudomonadales bacterium]|nr:MAPEG family protein [Pseudomonadales bacterium]
MEILYPMFAVIALSGLLFLFLAATRIPLIIKNFGHLQHSKHSEDLRPRLPAFARNVTDNYNHLFEQPTVFYALVTYIYLVQHVDAVHVYLAWAYVASRVIHSAIQITSNNVSYRVLAFI